jgi:prephenate dehydrogenase
MTVQITVIGLGQIGTSIGLALAKHTDQIARVGYDRALEIQNKAKSLGAFDSVKFTLPSAIENADVVILCLPFDQVEETLQLIAENLREDAVILDFSPQKIIAQKWFEQHVPVGRHYVGMVASIGPKFLDMIDEGVDAARADLFGRATIGIATAQGTSSQALKLAADLVDMMGGQAIFLDMLEADGMLMTTHLVPQLISAAILNATVDQPGWSEARRFAGRPYARATSAVAMDKIEALAQALISNPGGATHALDNAIGALTHFRAAIARGDQADLVRRLKMAVEDRDNWLAERHRADWDSAKDKTEAPKAGDFIKSLFIGVRSRGKKK